MTNQKIFIAILLLLLFSLNKFGLAKRLDSYLIDISRFPLRLMTSSYITKAGGASLAEENRQLKQKIKELNQRIVELEEAMQENKRLRGLLSFRKEGYTNIPAQVIGESSDSWRKVVIIDKGKRDGIRKDMAVVGKEGLIGRVVEVGLRSSRVMLIIDFNFKVAALVQRTRDQGIVQGNICSCVMRYIDKDSDVAKGDIVISSGRGGIYPKGLVIGKVDELNEDINRLYLKARILPAVNFHRLEEVLCLKKVSP
ncbi:MAG: rod shape-determining protein MreC [Candidatus Omnitrophica bacterium]|nr:rod shape-determining protein MreC [Candidatus Omnitrophota bacterium]